MEKNLLFKVGSLLFTDSLISDLDKTILREVILSLTRLDKEKKNK